MTSSPAPDRRGPDIVRTPSSSAPASPTSPSAGEGASARSPIVAGLVSGVGAYLLWGLLPLYFLLLAPAGPIEIVAGRVALALIACAVLLTATRGWHRLAAIVRRPRTLGLMAAAAVFIAVNWLVYVFASVNGLVVDASLGYFINPVVTVLLGVLVLRERLRVLQWAAVGVSVAAIVVLAVAQHGLPWIALALAASFGLYGLVKKIVGPTVDAVSGLTLETAWLTPLAVVAIVVLAVTGQLVTFHAGAGQAVAMAFAGIVTAAPLLLFASAARRLPLVHLGLAQYLTPVLQLLVGVLVLHEHMPLERWVGFGIVWAALVILTVDSVLAARRR